VNPFQRHTGGGEKVNGIKPRRISPNSDGKGKDHGGQAERSVSGDPEVWSETEKDQDFTG